MEEAMKTAAMLAAFVVLIPGPTFATCLSALPCKAGWWVEDDKKTIDFWDAKEVLLGKAILACVVDPQDPLAIMRLRLPDQICDGAMIGSDLPTAAPCKIEQVVLPPFSTATPSPPFIRWQERYTGGCPAAGR
jgi:hypothetical protein